MEDKTAGREGGDFRKKKEKKKKEKRMKEKRKGR